MAGLHPDIGVISSPRAAEIRSNDINTIRSTLISHSSLSQAAHCSDNRMDENETTGIVVESSTADQLREAAQFLQKAATLLSDVSAVRNSPSQVPRYGSSPSAARVQAGEFLSTGGTDNINKLDGPDSRQKYANMTQSRLPGHRQGWAAVEGALTDFDQQEIGGYKEDIDSLLTFTGLYSAVLTAFVIVSYPQLEQDTSSGVFQVLSLLAGPRSLPVIPGDLNSTFTTEASTIFHPSTAAIRINVLWFTSLVISLSTASFAILVKQWLRAYLAFATASPRGQLRIRHFRRGGLEKWKVFGIASLLPLLLQISLAFFFMGLCIFTFDIHPTIGKTTVPLVVTWALLFSIFTISPSFKAHCPYTTPALKGFTFVLRTRVYYPLVTACVRAGTKMLFQMFDTITTITHNPSQTSLMNRLFYYFQEVDERVRSAGYTPVNPTEETDVLKDLQYDLDILVSADALQADDDLLASTIARVALEQCNPTWIQMVRFAVRIIGNRIPLTPVDGERNLRYTLEAYSSLPSVVKDVIDGIFRSRLIAPASVVEPVAVPGSLSEEWQTIARWAFCIFLHINDPDAPLHHLHFDVGPTREWISSMPWIDISDLSHSESTANLEISGLNLAFLVGCWQIVSESERDCHWDTEYTWEHYIREHAWLSHLLQNHTVTVPHHGLRLRIIREATHKLTSRLNSDQALYMITRKIQNTARIFDLANIAIGLYSISATDGYDRAGLLNNGSRRTPLRLSVQEWFKEYEGERIGALFGENSRKRFLARLALHFTAVCQILAAVYISSNADVQRLSKVIHDMIDLDVGIPLSSLSFSKDECSKLKRIAEISGAQCVAVHRGEGETESVAVMGSDAQTIRTLGDVQAASADVAFNMSNITWEESSQVQMRTSSNVEERSTQSQSQPLAKTESRFDLAGVGGGYGPFHVSRAVISRQDVAQQRTDADFLLRDGGLIPVGCTVAGRQECTNATSPTTSTNPTEGAVVNLHPPLPEIQTGDVRELSHNVHDRRDTQILLSHKPEEPEISRISTQASGKSNVSNTTSNLTPPHDEDSVGDPLVREEGIYYSILTSTNDEA